MESRTQETKITAKDFQCFKAIGHGTFGKVFLVRDKLHRARGLMAVKQQTKSNSLKPMYELEVHILRVLRRAPFCLQLKASFQSSLYLYLVTDYYNGGSLQDHIDKETFFSGMDVALMAAELSEGLFFIHANYIIHCDIKPENVMFDGKGHCRLIDFNIAIYDDWSGNQQWPSRGTHEFWAPELFKNEHYDEKRDWWALGATLLTLVCKRNILDVHARPGVSDSWYFSALKRKITSFKLSDGCPEFQFGRFSRPLKEFLAALLTQDPITRLGSSREAELREHQLFKTASILESREQWVKMRRGETPPVIFRNSPHMQHHGNHWEPRLAEFDEEGETVDYYNGFDTPFGI